MTNNLIFKSNPQKPLNSLQKCFNRAIKTFKKKLKEPWNIKKNSSLFSEDYQKMILNHQKAEIQYKLIFVLYDYLKNNKKIARKERNLIANWISDISFELISVYEKNALLHIFSYYAGFSYEDLRQQQREILLNLLKRRLLSYAWM
ncbi:MAG: hypothetical protein NZM38_02930 [Cytophagales bacterium]|nr:hypothetical protein [Cytophagales bacterium]MDW8383707.1 hypothetical protein [Flammeovirgaceae bacterium]